MKRDEFLNTIIKSAEIDTDITENSVLEAVEEWDSLAMITTLALFKKHLELNITADELKKCQKISDILDLGESKYQ